jgi:hypothetical protein
MSRDARTDRTGARREWTLWRNQLARILFCHGIRQVHSPGRCCPITRRRVEHRDLPRAIVSREGAFGLVGRVARVVERSAGCEWRLTLMEFLFLKPSQRHEDLGFITHLPLSSPHSYCPTLRECLWQTRICVELGLV